MSRIRGLELLFNLVKSQLKSKDDCFVAALHCLLINENLQCVGTGEEFSDDDAGSKTELLPQRWNDNQEVYTLRYTSKDSKERYLVKIVKTGHILHVNVVLNENHAAAMSVNVDKHVADDYSEYSEDTFKELDTVVASFKRDVWGRFHGNPNQASAAKSSASNRTRTNPMPRSNAPPSYSDLMGNDGSDYGFRPAFPEIGGSDLDPFGRGGGSMLLDPSNFGIPSRSRQPPRGLPRGAVPPGARFDPFGPHIPGPDRQIPNPDHYRRPDDFDDDFI